MRQLISRLARRLIPPSETLEGYEHQELVEVVFQKTKAYNPKGPWPEMTDVSSVLDFGGGCGVHYKQTQSPSVRWAVVETPAMVERAKELATDKLQFFSDTKAAADWLGPIDVMHSNGALHFSQEPEQTLRQLCALRAKKMIWQRMSLSANSVERKTQSSFLGDNGPGSIRIKEKTVKYALTKIPEAVFLDAHAGYTLADRGNDWFRFALK